MKLKKLLFPLGLLLLLMPCACTEEETDLGINLQDPFTVYSGVRDTAYVTACTLYDDSLSTAGFMAGVFGNYEDANFGEVEAVLYSQISTPSDGVRITESVQIDSVVMTLVIDTVFPARADSTPVPLHIIVNQLAEAIRSDSAYIASDQLEESGTCFFDSTVYFVADSLRLRMRPSIYPVLQRECSQADFLEQVKGFSLRLGGDCRKLVTLDISATNTRLMVYYHNPDIDTTARQFEFTINGEAAHSMYVRHDYSGTPLAIFDHNKKDTIEGSEKLYLEPLGGTRVRLSLQPFLNRFHAQHPTAVIHYAELLLPVYDTADTQTPVRILAMKRKADGSFVYVTDADVLTNSYTYAGFDGYYNREKHQYRLRVTRHLQELMRMGQDYGTELIIDARRSSGFRTVLNGSRGDNPVRIDFVYSE
ncbi:MAG: DUF4270 family protein [Bacteroidales bacterium]|nr:DUF4270 family protein [Bacteroidales bacterium]